MPRAPKHAHLLRRGHAGIYHVRLDLPEDVRTAFGGAGVLSASTHTTVLTDALRVRDALVERWRAEIARARAGQPVASADLRRANYKAARASAVAGGVRDADLARLSEVLAMMVRQTPEGALPNLPDTAADPRGLIALIRDAGGYTQGGAPQPSVAGGQAVAAVDVALGARTPFGAHLDAWEQDRTTPDCKGGLKIASTTVVNYKSDLNTVSRYMDARGVMLEEFCIQHFNAFLRDEDAAGKSRAHLARVRVATGNYWKFVLEQNAALQKWWKGRDVFAGIVWPSRRTQAYRPEDPRFQIGAGDAQARFTPATVPVIWETAHEMGQLDLRDAILIAAYTGARREGVFRLHRRTVHLDNPIPWVEFYEKGSWRRVPIPDAILLMLRRRCDHPEPGGYLFRGGKNQKGLRGAWATNPMRRVLDEVGLSLDAPQADDDDGSGFHALRRTFVDLLQAANVEELHAAKIIGHRVKTLTYGLYAGDLPMPTKAEIMRRVIHYPRAPSYDWAATATPPRGRRVRAASAA